MREATGLEITAIPGDEESRLAFLAVKSGLGLADGSLTVFDTGGGSTQLTFGHGDTVDDRFSVDVGAVRFTEQFGLDGVVPDDALARARAAIVAGLTRVDGHAAPDALVGMGGAVTNMAAVMHAMAAYDPDRIQGSVIDRAEVDRQIELYRTRDVDARHEIVGLQPKRADVILAGALHRPDDHGQGRARLAHGERPGPPPRRARRAVRRMRGRLGPEGRQR